MARRDIGTDDPRVRVRPGRGSRPRTKQRPSHAAAALGIPVGALRQGLFVLLAVLVGVLVAVSGGIGFVGLVIPHLCRMVVGSLHRRLLPLAASVGGLFLLWVDVISRVLVAPTEMPLGVVTGLIGAPVFLIVMGRRNYGFGGGS